MATQGRFTVFSDENNVPSKVEPSKGRRAPLGVLTDTNITAGERQILQQKSSGNLAPSSQSNTLKGDRPLCDENSLRLKQADKENGPAVRPKIVAKAELPTREPLKSIDITSPAALGSPMIISPMPDTPKTQAKDWHEDLLDDKFFTRDYGDTHYAYMRDLESRLKARPDYMTRQRDISSTMRAVLVDWLVEVNEEYEMSDETLFLAVSLIDRFLSVMSVVRGKLQLVGTAAMFIASKVEEIYPPQLNKFVYITDDTYVASQIIRMEALLLKTLGFSLGGAHALAFLRRFAIEANVSLKVAHMAQYICELSLLSTTTLAFKPSEIGAASLILGMHHVELSIKGWTKEMREFADLDPVELQKAIDHLHDMLVGATASAHKATPEKFAHQRLSSVSLLPLQPTPPKV